MRDNGQRRQFLLRPGGDGRMLGLMDQRRGEETEEGAGRKGGTEGRNSQFINRHKREEMTEDTCQITSATTLPLRSPRQDLPPQIRGFPPSASATLLSIFLRFSSGGWCRVRVTRNTTKKKKRKSHPPSPLPDVPPSQRADLTEPDWWHYKETAERKHISHSVTQSLSRCWRSCVVHFSASVSQSRPHTESKRPQGSTHKGWCVSCSVRGRRKDGFLV